MIEKELKLQLEEAINKVESLVMDIPIYGDDTDKSLAVEGIAKIRLLLNEQTTAKDTSEKATDFIPDVSQRSEQLIAFMEFWNETPDSLIEEWRIKQYLESN